MKSLFAKTGLFSSLVVAASVSYTVFQEIFYRIFWALPALQTDEMYWYMEANPFFADAIFCVIVFPLYVLLYRAAVKRSVRNGEHCCRCRPTVKLIFACVVITLGMSGISTMWLEFSDAYLMEIPAIAESWQEFDEAFGYESADEVYLWPLLSVVLFGPLIEELLFRGIVLHYLSKIRRGWFAILISGLIFGIWHGSIIQSAYTAVMGCAFAIVMYSTGNIWLPIGMHVLNNFLATLPPALDIEPVWALLSRLELLCVVPAIYLLARMMRQIKEAADGSLSVSDLNESGEASSLRSENP